MAIYWFMFAIPAFFAIVVGPIKKYDFSQTRYLMRFLTFAFVVIIGFRYEIGADWFIYKIIVDTIAQSDLGDVIYSGDIGFTLVTWIFSRFEIYEQGPTLVCGAILMLGIWKFSTRQADPWLTFTAAVPYLIIVVGMGYVRQGAAIGLALLALNALEKRSDLRCIGWLTAAVLFHISSIILIVIVGIAFSFSRKALLIPLSIVAGLFSVIILLPRLASIETNYVTEQMQSSGAAVRLLMNALPSAAYLIFRKDFPPRPIYQVFWTIVAVLSLILFALVQYLESTTILDRIGLYFLPIQLYVFGNLPAVIARTSDAYRFTAIAIVALYTMVLGIWLFLASHAEFWLPYRSLLFIDGLE